MRSLAGLSGKLTHLSLLGCAIDNLSDLKELKRLRYLNLGNTKITDASLCDLKELKMLQVLQLENTAITNTGVEIVLRDLKRLGDLNVFGCTNVSHTVQSLRELGVGGKNLVYLSNNRVPRQ